MSQTFAKAPERLDKSGTQAPVGRGPRVVPLQSVAQVMRGTYFNPLRKDPATPLPRHYWELHSVRKSASDTLTVIRGTASDTKTGVSHILNGKKLKEAAEDQAWFLVLRPEITDEQLLEITAPGLRELWIDLEKNSWVVLSHFPQFEKRKLLRVPIWTSPWKARSGGLSPRRGGGDYVSADYANAGTITTKDLRAVFGTPSDPWEIQIDYGWFRTYLQFHHQDGIAFGTAPVPPGLCVKALGSKLDVASLTWSHGRVGGGTAIDDQGTIYVLHERDAFTSGDVEFCFEGLPGQVMFVDLQTSTPQERLKHASQKHAPTNPVQRYRLPGAWHSKGMEARVGKTGARKRWEKMRPTPIDAEEPISLDTDASSPLIFHLDDAVLYDHAKGSVTLPKGARVTLFDHRLGFRGPFDPVMTPLRRDPLEGGYLRAEEVVYKEGEIWVESTFVINHEGDFYVLREGRVDGEFGKTPCVGARKAVARAPENPIGDYLNGFPHFDNGGIAELHLLPDAYEGPYMASLEGSFLESHPTAKLCHLLVYVPLLVIADPNDPTTTVAQVNGVYNALIRAADRWNQAHPSQGASGKKDYVVIPEAGVKDGTRVVKLRYFFGSRSDGKQALTIQVRNQPTQTWGTRSFVSGGIMTFIASALDPADSSTDSDNCAMSFFTLAHELGHVMGLPDEYMETINVSSLSLVNAGPRIPRIAQRHDAYPFYADDIALMWYNQVSRLRYRWHLVHFLNQHAGAKAQLPEGPYAASYPAFRGGTAHVMPDGNAAHPWSVAGKARLASNRGDLVLYRLGDDEATIEKMFQRPSGVTGKGAWMNGVLMVVSKIWFNFVPSTAGDFPNHKARWEVVQKFYRRILSQSYKLEQRFFLEGPTSARLPRIAVVFQPRIEYGPLPTKDATEGDADFIVNVVFQPDGASTPAPPLNPPAVPLAGTPRLLVNRDEVGLFLLRFMLDATIHGAQSPNNGAIQAADIAVLARAVEAMTNAPANSFAVKTLP